jgi:signal transduction histidine kinase
MVASSFSLPPEHALLDAFSEGVMIFDAAWRIRFINKAAEALLRIPREELQDRVLGRDLLYVHEEQLPILRAVMRDRRRRSLGTFRAAATGAEEEKIIEADVCPIEAGGIPSGIAIIYRDITEWAGRASEAREEVAGSVHEFLAAIAHEIRTPVHAMLGYAELLRLGADAAAEPQATQISRLEASSRHLLHLVENLLDFGRLATGRLALEIAPASAQSVASTAVDVVSVEAEMRGITISQECREQPPIIYMGDEDRVRQILLNLLMNAIKFTGRGGSITLTCGTAPAAEQTAQPAERDPWVYFQVRDTGIGIAPDDLATIFDPYGQAARGRQYREGGVGLGLALSRDLARSMHGDLMADSEPGAGSVFTLWLPAGPPPTGSGL